MAPIAEANTQYSAKEEPIFSQEATATSRAALGDLGSGPNDTLLATNGNGSAKEVQDTEMQREWDQVASNEKQERIRQSSSHGLGIQLEGLNGNGEDSNGPTSVGNAHRASSPQNAKQDKEKVLKLSPIQIQELISSPDSIPVEKVPDNHDRENESAATAKPLSSFDDNLAKARNRAEFLRSISGSFYQKKSTKGSHHLEDPPSFLISSDDAPMSAPISQQPHASRIMTSPTAFPRQNSVSDQQRLNSNSALRSRHKGAPDHLDLPEHKTLTQDPNPSPMPRSIPLPPLSIPAYLELELSSSRPSPLYIHRSVASQSPYESSAVKMERLLNFILLPPALEQVLWFGALACLDSWLYSFTILPLRFAKALYILVSFWVVNISREAQFVFTFIINGVGRVWRRRLKASKKMPPDFAHNTQSGAAGTNGSIANGNRDARLKSQQSNTRRRKTSAQPNHRRQKSMPSTLESDDKADILKGSLIICTCIVLSYFDASRMYHWIRGQNAIKLYVIYNVLEVGDRLLSAIGQDVLECLFSQEALDRGKDGRSKVVRPFWLFWLALAYTTVHATALFYQVVTLNVAVNSYSNALITLLLSNQFVEIKSTVFKKFEKENLFQLTCADVVERFQLWLMLTIIASRNIVETGAFTSWFTVGQGVSDQIRSSVTNSTPLTTSPRSSTSILPQSFTFLPSTFFTSLTGGANTLLPQLAQVLGPFLIVLGSEMFVDWLKHAYIAKFNNTRPAIYGRFLDVLAKDYYTNAFIDQNLTKRLGLAVIPMACLFFRVSVQTYQMFLQALLPMQASSTEHSASLTAMHEHYSNLPQPSSPTLPLTVQSVMSNSFDRLSWLFNTIVENAIPSPIQSVTFFTIVLVLTGYLILLIFKLTLGILLLTFSRSRYKAMKEREQELYFDAQNDSKGTSPSVFHDQQQHRKPSNTSAANMNRDYVVDGGRRVGGWGVVEVDDDKRRWIYADDPNALRKIREKERAEKDKHSAKDSGALLNLDKVQRYEMVAKRIW
ncbi:cytomegalovirus gH-receptor family protein, putative [Talaromyces stipitatus ATCC 10500]|uniref:Cytomegalovirus gH-receptor family protein, putative n=1 Tax=Talaromyces stipitatus (strain ATCC 10500 / CBS 375.48 / QM 6759 / NRRL 1006) TaxID=441959 RepID=B8LV51_TALSN|nr:cytomegalovirus gH-receptor family protein, putative [Talaromyces stipitatus ATCC 10500]EED23101.1 cytomegalovirus gH-receptor family protein, putative [Talaromyces stipitatus ATCC 10500]